MITFDSSEFIYLYIFIFIVLVIILIFYIVNVFVPFLEQRRYLKMELGRCSRNEYHIWKARLKRLYVSMIPFIGPFIASKIHTHTKK